MYLRRWLTGGSTSGWLLHCGGLVCPPTFLSRSDSGDSLTWPGHTGAPQGRARLGVGARWTGTAWSPNARRDCSLLMASVTMGWSHMIVVA